MCDLSKVQEHYGIAMLFAVCQALYAFEAGAAASDEDLYFAELPVVASASRLPQNLRDAPTAMTILDRDIIRASGARDLNDLFRLVPGFQTFPNNTDPTRVSYHGLTDEDFSPRVQVLIDGRSQYSPLFRSGVNWNILPVAIADIERIEVVRGTNSAAYGTNAFLGVINIITVDPALVRGVSMSTSYGNQGVRDYALRTGGKLGESGNFRFSFQQRGDNGLNDRANWHDSLQSRLFDWRADWQLSPVDVLQVGIGQASAVLPQGVIGSLGEPVHDFSSSSSFFQMGWKHVLADGADVNLRYSFSRDSASDRFLAATGQQPADLLYWDGAFYGSSLRQEVEVQHTFILHDALRVAWGGGYRHDEVESGANFYGSPGIVRNISRLFENLEWKPVHWFTGNLGASFDDDSLAGSSFSPRGSLNFHLSPENTVRFGFAKATRTGSIVDYKGDRRGEAIAQQNGTLIPASLQLYDRLFLGNPNMPSEKLQSCEVGYLGDWRMARMSLDVRAFSEKIPNRLLQVGRTINQPDLCELGSCGMVTADFVTPVQRVHTRGVEYQLRWQPFESTRLMLSQAYTRITAEFLNSFLTDPSIIINGNLQNWSDLTEQSAPRLASSLMWMQKLPWGLEFSTTGYWQDKMKWTTNSSSAGYTRVDLRLAYPFALSGWRGEISYTAQSVNGAHGEFKANGSVSDRIVDRRDWLALRLDY